MIAVEPNEARVHSEILAGLGKMGVIYDLPAGDYGFRTYQDKYRLLVEHKEMDNLVSSILTDELTTQCRAMAKEAQIVYLLTEGWRTVDYKGFIRTKNMVYKLPWSYVEMYLVELQEAGIRILHSPNRTFTPKVLLDLYTWWQKDEHRALRQVKEANFKEFQRPLRRLATFSGYGPERAHLLLSKYKTLRQVFNADPLDRMTVKGIGPGLSRSLEKELDEVYVG